MQESHRRNWQGGVKKFKFSIRTSLRNRIHIRKICAQTSWHIPFKLPPEFVSLVRQVRGSCWSWRPVGPLSSAPYTSPSSYPLMRTFPPPAPTNILSQQPKHSWTFLLLKFCKYISLLVFTLLSTRTIAKNKNFKYTFVLKNCRHQKWANLFLTETNHFLKISFNF